MLTAKPKDKKFNDNAIQMSRIITSTIRETEVVKQEAPKQAPMVRSHTDSICLVVFILAQLVSVVVVIGGALHGDPQRLGKPYDPDHLACGVDSKVQDYPFVYFATPNEKFLYRTVCVSQCPNATTEVLECMPNSVVTSCKVNPSVGNLSQAVLVYDTVQYHSVCLPTTQYYYKQLEPYLYAGSFQQAASDINSSKWNLIMWICVSFVLSFFFLWLAEHNPTVVVWTFVSIFSVIALVGSTLSFLYYHYLDNPPPMPKGDTDQINKSDLKESSQSENSYVMVYLILSVALGVVGGITLITALFFRRRIALTILMVQVAADFVKTNKQALIMPIVVFVVVLGYFGVWLTGALFMYSACPTTDAPHQLPFEQVQVSTAIQVLAGVHLFSLLWFAAFAIGCSEFIITGAVADWYYKQGSDRNSYDVEPVSDTWRRLRTYHLGSVALASGLIAMVSFIRFLLEYLYKSVKTSSKREGDMMTCVASCCCCCLWVYETCINMLSKYAYVVVINLTGQAFFPSAMLVVEIIEKDLKTFARVGGLGETFTTVGRLCIASLTGMGCFLVAIGDQLLMPYVPAMICFVVAFAVSSSFMCVYGIAAEAIYVVYMHSRQVGGDEEMPQSTHTFQEFLKSVQHDE